MKKLLVAALMVVLPLPAFAAIQNVKVSGDITTSYADLSTFDLGLNTGTPGVPFGLKQENVFVTQTRLRVDADLSDNVSTEVGLINERVWNAENSSDGASTNYANDTDVQLYLATITLRELLYSPLTVTIGRQVFNYGNGFIMGNGGAINQGGGNLQYIDQDLTERTAYDGVTTTLDYKPLTISMIYFKNSQTLGSIYGNIGNTGLGGQQGAISGQSSDVYGYNLNYQLNDPMSTVIEQYMFSRIDDTGITGNNKENTLFVPGLRASTNPIKGLTVQAEAAWQLGKITVVDPAAGQQESEHRNAFAAQAMASYSLPVLDKYKPSVNASYTYVSGDKDAGANYDDVPYKSAKTYTAWDEFNSIQGAGTIYRDIFPMSNEHIVSVGGSVNPLEDVTAAATWSGLWAVDTFGPFNPLSIYQPNTGTTLQAVATKGGNTYLGNEADVNLTYNYTEDVTFGLSVGWFVPGSAFSDTNKNTASQAIANVAVTF
jgi:hypothetical protein